MAEGEVLYDFCGSTFWDLNVTWHTDNPDFTPCFERTVLVWIPCAFLWLLAPLETHYLIQSVDRLIPWSWLNISKLAVSSVLVLIQFIEIFYAVHLSNIGENVPGVLYLTPIVILLSLVLQMVFIVMEKKRGIQSCGYLFVFWLLLFLCGLPEFRTYIVNAQDETAEYHTLTFGTYMVHYPLVVVMLILNCFGDAPPQYVDYPRSEKVCPEVSASFLSRTTFAWVDGLIWKGYRQPLKEEDLWDLSYENAAHTVVSKWEKNWQKTKAKAYKKGESHTSATYANNYAHVEISGTSGDKEYLSILPALVKTFGPSFFFGGILKFSHDVLQFLSPQVLREVAGLICGKLRTLDILYSCFSLLEIFTALIKFTESSAEDTPMWHGYLYAALMFICAQIQSLCLGQYFMRMFLVGLRMRTAIISAVYTKAMRISNSAKKKSTTGEIVNLMSVDAQRFMDITTYINMLWSAPLQIGLALYFLWELLGPSVLAGLAVMIIVIPINGVIAKKTKDLQLKQMKNKDHRVKLMNEILNGIKVLKLYAWEQSFEEQVLQVRGKEIKVLKQMAYLTAGTSFIWTCTPFLVSLATFATYVSISDEHVLDAQTAFVSLSLFNLLRFPIAMLPMLISSLVQASVSLKRMNKFMNVDELDPNSVIHDTQESRPIVVENGTFAWGHDEDDSKPVLKGINLSVNDGSLVAVVGNVGAGKSSLCSAILGEMEKQSGRVNVKGKVAYVSQQAWIQNATLENNILFNQSKDNSKYEMCIKSCALRADLEMLPAGDQTEIGEKGINLSGGQKQRISLARAVYSDADIYLLDDPLSAVDSHVGKHIFEHVIGPQGILKRKTRILVTHGLTYLSQVDKIIVLKNGVITEEGTYKELLERKGEFQEFLLQYLTESAHKDDDISLEDIRQQLESSLGKDVVQKQMSRQKRESESDSLSESTDGKVKPAHHEKKVSESESGNSVQASNAKKTEKAGEKLIEAEKAETGKVQLEVYKYYIRAIGIMSTLATVLFYLLSQSCTVGSNIWLSEWSEEASKNETMESHVRDMYLGVYGAFGVGQALFILTGAFSLYFGTLMAGAKLHSDILSNVMHLPMSFFDTNPVGRLINRFSKDVDTLDSVLPWTLRSWLMCFITVISTFLVIIFSTPIFVVVMLPIMIIYFFVQRLYVASSRQLKRIESVSRSPIYSHFQETIQGSSTIRAYGRQSQFISESEKKVDFNQICNYPSVMTNRWLAVRLEFIGNTMTFFAALFAVMSRGSISGGIVGLSVSYALSVTQTLNWLVRMTSDVETNIVAVERIKEYSEIPQEAPWDITSKKPQKDWPEEGVVEFRNYSTRYREGLDLVVKNINCKILRGEKIGIVGRTGAGKSSLTLALFRIIEPAGGEIVIDNVDISKIGLHDLRGKLTIIPQDPVLFSGTLRMNLDPFSRYEDSKVWSALEQAHLKEFVSGLTSGLQHEVAEGGENLSVGQRQLVCLARALLRKSRVLVLDEATAAVDLETDDLIQQTIRREFSDCTVITIAHRLNTIMDSTRVLVLAHGEIKEFDSPSALLANKNSLFYGMAKDAGLV